MSTASMLALPTTAISSYITTLEPLKSSTIGNKYRGFLVNTP